MSEPRITWRQAFWQRPLDPTRVAAVLRQWASDQRSPHVVIEARMTGEDTLYLIGWPTTASYVAEPLSALPNITLRKPLVERVPITTSGSLRASTRHRAFRSDDPEQIVRGLLAVSVRLKNDEQLVLQIVLGPRRVPLAVSQHTPSSIVIPWWQVAWSGTGGQIDGEKRQALRQKVSNHGFACVVRLGVRADTPERRKTLLLSLLAAVRVSETPGLKLSLHPEPGRRLDSASIPWRWALRLGVPELVGLTVWPLGDADLPGQPAAHPKLLPPPPGTTGTDRVVADVAVPGSDQALVLPIERAVHHLHVVGPTGTGKSTLLGNLILQDIEAGHGVVVVEPKRDLTDDVLARLPKHRRDDVIILDASDQAPVGLNPLGTAHRRPELVADAMVAVFKQLYGKNIGPRSQDILYAGLLTLALRPDASLVMLPLLFTNPGLRRSLTAGIKDPLTLEPFWATFEHWSDAERTNAVAPVMNKLRPLLRPGLRAVLGQRNPRFDMEQVFSERKILLVPLQRGVIGPDAASLLGSLIVAALWQTVQGRSRVPSSKRSPVMVYIDEVQDYLHLPTDLGEALAQARGYGVGFTLAHQFFDQLAREMRAAVLANARSRVAFQLTHSDAVILEKAHPEISAQDFESLPRYAVYASLFANGMVTPYASGRTRPLPKATSNIETIKRLSRERYGQPLDAVERGFADFYDTLPDDDDLGPTGRRRRS